MMKLRIDGTELILADDRVELPSFDVKRLRNCEGQREGDAIMLSVRTTSAARELFGFADQAYPAELFNNSYHYGEVVVDGVVLYSGVVSYLSTTRRGDDVIYNIKIATGGATWADRAATTKFRDIPIDATRMVELSTICKSWTDDNPIKMLPVNRDSYPTANNTGLYEVYHPKLPQDYHPFISVKSLMDNILCDDNGYRIKSEFLCSPLFEKLMMSGAYKGMEAEAAYATMGFNAMLSTSSSATADSLGRVDVSPPKTGRNIGAMVDTVSPTTVDENGKLCEGAYSNGGCFTFVNGVPQFCPKRDIDVAFDLHFKYTTDYVIASSKWLKGFNRVYVGNGCDVDISLPNPFKDRRNSVVAGTMYKLYIFDYDETAIYRITDVGVVSGRISSVQFKTAPITRVKLYKRTADSLVYTEYNGDWALYDGFVEERGTQSVELTLRTPYQRCTPSSPVRFNNINFAGAEPGQQLTLHAGCSITPVFGGTVGYGDMITFKDVANHDIRSSDIVDAVVQMFNLCIYTHRPSNTIFVEPYDDFFNGDVVDWRDKQRDCNAILGECVVDSFMVTQLGYQPADGAVGYCHDDGNGEFGSWRHIVDSYATKQSVRCHTNPIFHPTASMATLVGTAPSASVLVVGDRDKANDVDYIEPRIVLYHGVKRLPTGEYWPAPYNKESYPLVAFHSVDMGESLCFEDRDGIEGLHRYYDNELGEGATRQMLTTDIYLPPEQYAVLLDPNTNGANLRSRFRLNIDGTPALFRLDAIEGYDHTHFLARCRFQRVGEE